MWTESGALSRRVIVFFLWISVQKSFLVWAWNIQLWICVRDDSSGTCVSGHSKCVRVLRFSAKKDHFCELFHATDCQNLVYLCPSKDVCRVDFLRHDKIPHAQKTLIFSLRSLHEQLAPYVPVISAHFPHYVAYISRKQTVLNSVKCRRKSYKKVQSPADLG